MHALLCVLAELVLHAAAKLGMCSRRQDRACDTAPTPDALPLAKPGADREKAQTSQPSFSGKRKARIPGISVGPARELANAPRDAINQDAWDEPRHDTVDAARSPAAPSAVIPAPA